MNCLAEERPCALDHYRARVVSMEGRLSSFSSLVASLTARIDSLEDENSGLRQELAEANRRIDSAAQHFRKLQHQVEGD